MESHTYRGPADLDAIEEVQRASRIEALRRMRERGVEVAGVNTWAGHASNIAFCESCGFERTTAIDCFTRPG
jgi:hypothetical protein